MLFPLNAVISIDKSGNLCYNGHRIDFLCHSAGAAPDYFKEKEDPLMKSKRLIGILCAIALLAGTCGYLTGNAPDVSVRGFADTFGDINGDGVVNASDATLILAYSAYVGSGGDISFEAWLTEHNKTAEEATAPDASVEELPEDTSAPDMPAESSLTDEDNALTIVSWNPYDVGPMVETYNSLYSTGETEAVLVSLDCPGSYTNEAMLTYLNSGDDVDLFCAEPDWIRPFIDDPSYTLPLSALELTEADYEDTYPFALELGKNADGELMAVADFVSPGFYAYNTRLASEYLGVESPEEMQEKVADWNAFAETAEELQQYGIRAAATLEGMWQAYAWNTDCRWLEDGAINPEQAENFLPIAHSFADSGYVDPQLDMWTDDWAELAKQGNTMGFFYANWTLYPTFSYAYDSGDDTWNIVRGPDSFFWGGVMFCTAAQCNTKATASDFLRTFTLDADRIVPYMAAINEENTPGYYLSSNRKAVEMYMEQFGSLDSQEDYSCKSSLLGGQDPFPVLDEIAATIRWDHTQTSQYDLEFRNDMSYRCRDMDWRTDSEIIDVFLKDQAYRYPELN